MLWKEDVRVLSGLTGGFLKKTRGKSYKKILKERLLAFRPIIALVLIVVLAVTFGELAIPLYLHHYGFGIHIHDPIPFIIVIGISIVILMLPFINKLKISDIEIELETETAGYRPVGPASVMVGSRFKEDYSLRLPFFFARFWY
jgi:hypothetical protein